MAKFISGGNFGDVIHELYVIKKIYEHTKEKGELYLKQDLGTGVFTRPVESICDDLRDVLLSQEYMSSISSNLVSNSPYLNLSEWRKSQLLLKVCWTELLTNHYSLPPVKNKIEPWIKVDGKNEKVSDRVLIHQSKVDFRKSESFPWQSIIENNNCLFITYSDEEYTNFKYKNMVDVFHIKDFKDCCELLNSCKFYVGNLTSITAVAHAMGIPRLTELAGRDAEHYKDEYKYYDNFYYISEYHSNSYLDGIESYIKL